MNREVWDPLSLAQEFIQFDTITPNDYGLQPRIISYLEKMGFAVQKLPFEEVHNFYARLGNSAPNFCFAGHTDVVSPGALDQWRFSPFSGTVEGGLLYGRGAADMKGAIAAMISAVSSHLNSGQPLNGSISFLITGDEEGPSLNGTAKVMAWLKQKREKIDYCLVGEPTSNKIVGDTIKNGRRGSINGRLTLYGVQGHAAYPHLARNPLHECLDVIQKLIAITFDQGNHYFDPTHLSLTNVQGGTGADNVTPDRVEFRFNIRHGTESSLKSIKEKIENLLSQSGIQFSLNMKQSGEAFMTQKGKLIDSLIHSVKEVSGITPQLSTSGGTSDARFIAPEGIEVAELGLRNDTIHKVNESISVEELKTLTKIYEKILKDILQN